MPPPRSATLASQAAHRKQVERRQAARLAPGRLTPCLIRHSGEADQIAAHVHNLSALGAGLIAEQDFPVGVVLPLLLINAAHTFAVAAELRVIRTFRIASGDYFLGGEFTRPLGYNEVFPFMM